MNTIYLILTLWTSFTAKDLKSTSIAPPDCSPDYETLKAFYRATDGGHWTHTWDTTLDCTTVRTWHGVRIDGSGRVITLQLRNNNLSGNIPPSFGNFQNLTSIDFSFNSLTGNIPLEIGNLSNLNRLGIANNHLSGSLPSTIGGLQNLISISLGGNNLVGEIPASFGNLNSLKLLNLAINKLLSGHLPQSLGNLHNLTYLYLEDNNFSGTIPPSYGNLSRLIYLGLHKNNLTGNIPSEFGNLSNLKILYLNNNHFTGCFPQNLHNLCNQLEYFSFYQNPGLPGGGDFASFCSSPSGSNSTIWYLDADHDDHAISDTISCDSPGTGYTTTRLPIDDCNDHNAFIHPGAPDYTCDGIDDDCDGLIDEDFIPMTCLTCLHGMVGYNGPQNAAINIIQPTYTNPTGTITVTNKTPLDSVSFDFGMTYQLNDTKSGLAPGDYQIYIKNSNGCKSDEAVHAAILTACVPVCLNGLDSVYSQDDTRIITPIGSPSGGHYKLDNAPLTGDLRPSHLSVGIHTVSYSIVIPPYSTVVSKQIRIR